MSEVDYARLPERYSGCYVARRDGEDVASAETCDELSDELESLAVEWGELMIEYVEPPNVVSVY